MDPHRKLPRHQNTRGNGYFPPGSFQQNDVNQETLGVAMVTATENRVTFGSSQERRLFPVHFAPDRLGNHLTRPAAPHLGPGTYNNHQVGTIVHVLQTTPSSKRGFGSCANTAARFTPAKMATPSPQQYQPKQNRSRVPPPGKTPFGSTSERFRRDTRTAAESPGPAAFSAREVIHKKVSWPMCFGRPDWSRLPQLEQKSVRGKLTSEKDFLKQRNRLAYLSLYYD